MNGGRRYRILGVLGKGGFGTVYRAEMIGEAGFSKIVALKVLNPDVEGVEEIARRLRDEARILGLVRHRAVVKVDALIRLEGRWTVVMEYADGVDLSRLIARGPVPPGPALEIVGEVASALAVAWDQPGLSGEPMHLLHRDIKPSNLQITETGEVKVLDFGTARATFAAREAETRSLAFGTPDYMAPERWEFNDQPAGDVYALGAVLCELLTGERVGRTSPRESRHAEVCARALAALAGQPEALVALVAALLSYQPADRPTAVEVARRCRALRGALGGPWLADWASEVVPPIVAERSSTLADPILGAVLSEQSGGDQVASGPRPWPTPPPRPAPWRRRLGLLLAILGVAGALVLVWRPWRPRADSATVAPVDTAAGVSAPPRVGEEEVAPPPDQEVEPGERRVEDLKPDPVGTEEVGLDEGSTERVEQGVSRPTGEEAVSSPGGASSSGSGRRPDPGPGPSLATVVLTGDATQVRFVDRAGRAHAPGALRAGRYSVYATFEGRGEVPAGAVTMPASGQITVNCQRAFARCELAD